MIARKTRNDLVNAFGSSRAGKPEVDDSAESIRNSSLDGWWLQRPASSKSRACEVT
jgi:hypothetical protein